MQTNLDRIIEAATDVLGSPEKASEWVQKMSATLGGTPEELSKTSKGTDAVLLHLAGISRSSVFDL